jgi:hypothetical protein
MTSNICAMNSYGAGFIHSLNASKLYLASDQKVSSAMILGLKNEISTGQSFLLKTDTAGRSL